MAEPGTGAANGQDHFFLQGWDGFCSYRTSGPIQAEGTKTHATSLQHAIPGAARRLVGFWSLAPPTLSRTNVVRSISQIYNNITYFQ
jgi:uncharacterized membrane protein